MILDVIALIAAIQLIRVAIWVIRFDFGSKTDDHRN